MSDVTLGKLITGDAGRDCVHVAIAPVVAGEGLCPGVRVGIKNGLAYFASGDLKAIGIVDPFLTEMVQEGQRFYLCLFPGTVTSLRHVWTSPAFVPTPPKGGVACWY